VFCHGERVRATAAGLGSADRECFPGARVYMYTERVIGSRAYSLCVARKHTRTSRVLYTHTHTLRDVCALETQQ